MKGHVWISLGTCSDGSVLIVHSTTGNSRTGQPGSGVSLSAIGYDKDCEAYILADTYMAKYYSEWYRRYSVPLRSPENYFKMDDENAGRFTWNTTSSSGLSDSEGIQNMTPAEVLKLCFGE